MSGTIRTCYEPVETDAVLEEACRQSLERPKKPHVQGFCVLHRKVSGLEAFFITDGLIDCEQCGPEVRRLAVSKALKGFSDQSVIYQTLVRPTSNARAATGKQLREKGGKGWYIPIFNATVLISNIPMLGKARTPYSSLVDDPARENFLESLLSMWWPDDRRMSWANWPSSIPSESAKASGSDDGPRERLGFANTSLPGNLDKVLVYYVEAGRFLDIQADKFDPAAIEALRRSGFRQHEDFIDAESAFETPDPDTTQRKDTG